MTAGAAAIIGGIMLAAFLAGLACLGAAFVLFTPARRRHHFLAPPLPPAPPDPDDERTRRLRALDRQRRCRAGLARPADPILWPGGTPE